MNLAFLTRRYGKIGGTERDLHELTTRLLARGHSIHIYCCETRMDPAPGIQIHRVPTLGFGRLARLASLAIRAPRHARRGGHDLIISYERVFSQDIARCGGGTHKLFLQRMAEKSSAWKRWTRSLDPYHRLLLHIEKTQFSPGHYRRAHAVSEAVADELVEVYGVPRTAIDVVYCGVDTDIFQPANRSSIGTAVRSELGIADSDQVVLFLGNGFRRKGLDALLAALPHTPPKTHALVVGTDSKLASYQAQCAQLGIDQRVHFVGQQSDTPRYYAAADAFALPSVQEAFGIVVLEAMATGLPCLVSARAGAAEVLPASMREHLLADPSDAPAFAKSIADVLSPDDRARLGADCRASAMAYSLEEHTNVSEQLYRELIEAHKNSATIRS